jgi:hypothetical protein
MMNILRSEIYEGHFCQAQVTFKARSMKFYAQVTRNASSLTPKRTESPRHLEELSPWNIGD